LWGDSHKLYSRWRIAKVKGVSKKPILDNTIFLNALFFDIAFFGKGSFSNHPKEF
jgi:hypothetical protein